MTDPVQAVAPVLQRFQELFGPRLQAFLVYGERQKPAGGSGAGSRHVHTLALVDQLTGDDLAACAPSVPDWRKQGLATPLVLSAAEFARSLDAFPLEYGEIIADHLLVAGTDPFEHLQARPADLRRACEVQAKSHLLHLREGYLETGGKPEAVAALIRASAPALAALLRNVARLEGAPADDHATVAHHTRHRLGLDGDTIHDVLALTQQPERLNAAGAQRLFPAYLDAVERLVHYVDTWTS
ncbi:MAG TPA: hypothetical protein VNE16_08640 [Vicinamibacterales bacterium]|nr:hypothetical protein [Vicinamibacterales bacterium]